MKTAYDPVAGLYNELFDSMDIRRNEFQWVANHADFSKDKTVLDIGCGNGILLKTISPAVKHGIGADSSPAMLSCAAKNCIGCKNIELLRISGSKLSIPAGSIDIVVSFYSFRYLQTDKILSEILRVIKPDGRLLIVDMFQNRVSPANVLFILKDKLKHSLYFLFHPAKKKQLKKLVRNPGWKSMLSSHPLKLLAAFKHKITAIFPFAEFHRLDTGIRAQTVAVQAGTPFLLASLKNKQLPRICVMDWGIGGMGFFSMFKKQNPKIPVLYLSDTGFTPYGIATKNQLEKRLGTIVRFCEFNKITHLVIACNAMSSILAQFKNRTAIHITGVIVPAVEVLKHSAYDSIAVIGGKRTIQSNIYKNGLAAPGKTIMQQIAQPLSGYIEQGDTQSAAFQKSLEKILLPLQSCSCLVLGCTHYKAALKQIRVHFKGEIIDPAQLLLEWVKKYWKIPASTATKDIFCTTGDPEKMKTSASLMFFVKIKTIHEIRLPV